MLISDVIGIQKVSRLSAVADVRGSNLLSASDLFYISISGSPSLSSFEPSGFCSVKITYDNMKADMFGYNSGYISAGTFTETGEYAKIVIGGVTRYIPLFSGP